MKKSWNLDNVDSLVLNVCSSYSMDRIRSALTDEEVMTKHIAPAILVFCSTQKPSAIHRRNIKQAIYS